MSFTVVIAGRPNVGKSTLFNRLAGKRLALVDDMPGLTRDRKEAEAELGRRTLRLIDTAGLEEADAWLDRRAHARPEPRRDPAGDVILFMIDARAGMTPVGRAFAAAYPRLRTSR